LAHEDVLGRLVALAAERAATARAAGAPAVLVGVTGGVAFGKTTLAGQLAEGLARALPGVPVEVTPTDGFLKPNSVLAAEDLIHRKGFPETYDTAAFHAFLDALAEGRPAVTPVYSHIAYDIVPGETRALGGRGVVIVEGVNVLQTAHARARFGLSIYVDADPDHAKAWYLARLDAIIANEPRSLIAQVADPEQRRGFIEAAWTGINLVNLKDHIAPTADLADVIVRKGADHKLLELVARTKATLP
jgi:type I pantothenate kinase